MMVFNRNRHQVFVVLVWCRRLQDPIVLQGTTVNKKEESRNQDFGWQKILKKILANRILRLIGKDFI